MTTATKEKQKSMLTASTRQTGGKGSSRELRRNGQLPGVLYGKGQQPVSIALSYKEVSMEYQRGRFRSRLIDINLDGKNVKALPKELQFNPVSDLIEHVDFIKVEAGSKLRVMVPVKFSGQEKSTGLKRGGVLNIVRHEIEFSCAPESIPTSIEVNVSDMDIGDSVHINAIKLPNGVVPVIKRNFTIATVAGRKAEEEVATTTTAAATDATAAPGAAGAAAPAAGAAAPAAGAAAPAAGAKKEEPKKK